MNLLTRKKISSIDSYEPMAVSKFSNMILEHLTTHYNHGYDELIIVCIGTDRSTGDCLGPLTGHKLFNSLKRYDNIHVLGTLDDPVHAKNLSERIQDINLLYSNPFIVAIDACLGNVERIGHISLSLGPLKPGAGVNKDLPKIGDMHITGVVNLSGFMEYVVLQNTRLSVVMRMADVISSSFITALWRFTKSNKAAKN
ncbi:spore protease YyaC [Sporosalibacterium faouarense]|uniref:spore protease YyaC n=1 Tax=Sporosalibacterium faouarense TaxID=516123 RepID=UPI00141D53F5|nr:spore protease YyaC [Sporosalibacterium faouarense]MTI48637.1 spore protease YyaC [Bacillota bacterium]